MVKSLYSVKNSQKRCTGKMLNEYKLYSMNKSKISLGLCYFEHTTVSVLLNSVHLACMIKAYTQFCQLQSISVQCHTSTKYKHCLVLSKQVALKLIFGISFYGKLL